MEEIQIQITDAEVQMYFSSLSAFPVHHCVEHNSK